MTNDGQLLFTFPTTFEGSFGLNAFTVYFPGWIPVVVQAGRAVKRIAPAKVNGNR